MTRRRYEGRSMEAHARTHGAGNAVKVSHDSNLLLGKIHEPTRAIPIDPYSIDRAIDYVGTVYQKGDRKYSPAKGFEPRKILGYRDILSQLGQLDDGHVLVVKPVPQSGAPKEVARKKGRANRRRQLLESLASEGDE